MLKKLIKNEFKETWKMFVPFIGVYLALSTPTVVFSNMLTKEWYQNPISSLISTANLLFTLFTLMASAAMTISFVFVVKRVHKTLLGKSGYITHTLPAKVEEILISKIVVLSFWQFIVMLSYNLGLTAQSVITLMPVPVRFLQPLFGSVNGVTGIIAAMSIGYSFNRFKAGLSVLFYTAGVFTMGTIGLVIKYVIFSLIEESLLANNVYYFVNLLSTPVFIFINFMLAKLFMKRRLNLE